MRMSIPRMCVNPGSDLGDVHGRGLGLLLGAQDCVTQDGRDGNAPHRQSHRAHPELLALVQHLLRRARCLIWYRHFRSLSGNTLSVVWFAVAVVSFEAVVCGFVQ